MQKSKLRKEGGSTVVTIPTSILSRLDLSAGAEMAVTVTKGAIELRPTVRRPKYRLDDLLAQCDFRQQPTTEEREWMDAPDVGGERLE